MSEAAITPKFWRRDFSDVQALSDILTYKVNSYSWNAIGGPEKASITAFGNINGIWDAAELLRSPVVLYDWRGVAVWWGYVNRVSVRVGAVEVGVTMEEMANSIAVNYTLAGESKQALTSWSTDADSAAEYGTKELLLTLAEVSQAAAENYRAAALEQRKYPVPTISITERSGSLSATIECVGWMQTLGWRYYENTGTASVETTTQIGTIVTGKGPLLTSTIIDNASGINTTETRDGRTDALQIIRSLLKSGMSSGTKRLLATVTAERALRVSAEPTYDPANPELVVRTDGKFYDGFDQTVLEHTCPVGKWCQLRDVVSPLLDQTRIGDLNKFFVERATYNPQTMRLKVEPRVVRGDYDMGEMGVG